MINQLFRPCFVTYPFFLGNGPWNYMYEMPPEGVKKIYTVGIFIDESPDTFRIACDWYTSVDGSIIPIHIKQFSKNIGTTLNFL